MGYCINPIAVDLEHVASVVGAKDEALLADLVEQFAPRIREIDRLVSHYCRDEEGITGRQAMTHILMGERYSEAFGFVYGYALEILCEYFGELLPNEEWSAMRMAWFDQVDETLASAGVGSSELRVTNLFFRTPPIPLPEIQDFPGIGYVTKAEIGAVLSAISEGRLAGVSDLEVRESLDQLRGWLQVSAGSGRDLVTFYA